MPVNDNLAPLREMLDEAYSVGEINTLAFDLFPQVYRNFADATPRASRIEQLVLRAKQRGRIADLIAYTQKHNPHQYAIYASRLKEIEGESSAAPLLARNCARFHWCASAAAISMIF